MVRTQNSAYHVPVIWSAYYVLCDECPDAVELQDAGSKHLVSATPEFIKGFYDFSAACFDTVMATSFLPSVLACAPESHPLTKCKDSFRVFALHYASCIGKHLCSPASKKYVFRSPLENPPASPTKTDTLIAFREWLRATHDGHAGQTVQASWLAIHKGVGPRKHFFGHLASQAQQALMRSLDETTIMVLDIFCGCMIETEPAINAAVPPPVLCNSAERVDDTVSAPASSDTHSPTPHSPKPPSQKSSPEAGSLRGSGGGERSVERGRDGEGGRGGGDESVESVEASRGGESAAITSP